MKMMSTTTSSRSFSLLIVLVAAALLISFPISAESRHGDHNEFLQCLSLRLQNHSHGISDVVYTPNGSSSSSSSYWSVLRKSIHNLRFMLAPAARPQVIVTPLHESHIPAIVVCAKLNGMQIRTRSGGHDYEGLSYTSPVPFVIVDLFNLNHIDIDVERMTGWVQTGATNGQLYYAIGQKSKTIGFPAGSCPTVGVGGLFSGGGYGPLFRKYGLAADNIVDARMVDANGRMLDRKSMGEDVFWAIRGGGGASFGVITAWKIKLVTVPETVTIFSVSRTLQQNATELVHKWQYVAPFMSNDMLLAINVGTITVPSTGERTVQASFNSMFLGRIDQLLELLQQSFPELGVRREDCLEVSYIQAVLFFGGYNVLQSPELLTSRNPEVPSAIRATRFSFKAKTDYLHKPIPKSGIEGMWKLLLERAPDMAELLMVPYGGRMSDIPESAIPFPHRAGTLYKFQQLAHWIRPEESEASFRWVRSFYGYLTPFVSKSPRLGYLNYRDLDLGVNNGDKTSYREASKWGLRYYKSNFKRLVQVKTMIDPTNYFRNEQSIPVRRARKNY
ncbi:tetrahydroberberine oxidase-like [Andrographis paniculata]|uniref:tetrahydroberberine oxidase-like n=1 Tax=Andrographis paniculata TaxID=175694 RepID=UPI0021E8F18A|nr:tetrahydroberberine oxidase-like [Andrographis paniculata]